MKTREPMKPKYSTPPADCPHCGRKRPWKASTGGMVLCYNCGNHHFTVPIPDHEKGRIL